jgi:hypothetical protein
LIDTCAETLLNRYMDDSGSFHNRETARENHEYCKLKAPGIKSNEEWDAEQSAEREAKGEVGKRFEK